ncbi:hypothetical protein EDB85DRAFT_157736 [Lactarius pseudohatsudake]|nr:hypothetical protein EDB85DRAFT_157736 [Lactarius pseudohatsudake]
MVNMHPAQQVHPQGRLFPLSCACELPGGDEERSSWGSFKLESGTIRLGRAGALPGLPSAFLLFIVVGSCEQFNIEYIECSTFKVQGSITFNVQTFKIQAQGSRFSVQRSTFNCSMFNVQRSMFNVQRSVFNVQRSTFGIQWVNVKQ